MPVTKNSKFSDMVPVRFTREEKQMLHKILPPGGIQRFVRSLIDPTMEVLMRAHARERDEG